MFRFASFRPSLSGSLFSLFLLTMLAGFSTSSFAQLQVCGAAAGSDEPETRFYSIQTGDGSFEVSYNMFAIFPDRMIIRFGSEVLEDTGCVLGSSTLTPSLPAGVLSGTISIEMLPGRLGPGGALLCDQGDTGTAWNYELRANACEEVDASFEAVPVPTLTLWGLLALMLLTLGIAGRKMRLY